MPTVRRAVIDVGTNSVKVLVADVSGHGVRPLFEESNQTRLGRGFYETRRLQPGPVAETAAAVARFAGTARMAQAVSIRVIATSAARDAVNAAELVDAIRQSSGLKLEIISGEQEAEWAFQGVTTDPGLAADPLLLLEVGGGSSQFIFGHGTQTFFSASFPLGTVRMMELFPHSNPPSPAELAACRKWLRDFLVREVEPRLRPVMEREVRSHADSVTMRMAGVGGSMSILARIEAGMEDFDRERIEATRLTLDRLRWHTERMWAMPLGERRKIVGLPPNRADVILNGVAAYEAVMERLGFAALHVSTRGLRFAALMDEPVPPPCKNSAN